MFRPRRATQNYDRTHRYTFFYFSPENPLVNLLEAVLSSSLPFGIPMINKKNIFDVQRIEFKAYFQLYILHSVFRVVADVICVVQWASSYLMVRKLLFSSNFLVFLFLRMYFFKLSSIQDILLKDGTCSNLFAPINASLVPGCHVIITLHKIRFQSLSIFTFRKD